MVKVIRMIASPMPVRGRLHLLHANVVDSVKHRRTHGGPLLTSRETATHDLSCGAIRETRNYFISPGIFSRFAPTAVLVTDIFVTLDTVHGKLNIGQRCTVKVFLPRGLCESIRDAAKFRTAHAHIPAFGALARLHPR